MTVTADTLKSLLHSLDPSKDAQWAEDGQPRLEVLRFLAKDATITRDQVIAADPLFSRTALVALKAGTASTDVGTQTPSQVTPPVEADKLNLAVDPEKASASIDEVGVERELTYAERFAQFQEQITDIELEIDFLNKRLEAIRKARDTLVAENGNHNHDSLATALSSYFQSADRDRGIRSEVIRRQNEQLPGLAPIDAARARGARRGI